jgi:hypothetical protein
MRTTPWHHLLALALSLSTLPACGEPAEDDTPLAEALADDGKADSLGRVPFAVTASSVQALNGSLSSVRPAVRTADPGHSPEFYLQPGSALGPAGPLGAWGPLGALGPVGNNSWNPSAWISGFGDWSSWSRSLTAAGGPLSESGPLGPNGPLSVRAYTQTLPAINDFSKQLQAGGVWTVLGPIGPLGALGPLGPLGPVGAHGFVRDSSGRYLQAGQPVRTVRIPYQGRYRTYELYEHYPETTARSLQDNDTSFMVSGAIDRSSEVDAYTFTSRSAQYVTLLLLPENSLSDFDLELLDSKGRAVASSRSDGRQTLFGALVLNLGNYIDFIQLPAQANARFTARVSARTTNPLFPTYRLFVVGSTSYLPPSDISGAHQLPLR